MFPENGVDREKYIFDQVLVGNFAAKWTEIVHAEAGHEVRLQVMDDALMVDGVRVNVSATLEQQLADIFDASLLTPKVADLMYAAAARPAKPCPVPWAATVAAMKQHSTAVDKQVGTGEGLANTVGKHWVLDKGLQGRPGQACNYGWHFVGQSFQGIAGYAPAFPAIFGNKVVKVIQPNATAHDIHHSDYSQVCQLVAQQCWVDGTEMRFADLVKSATLAYLVSHQGPLTIDRQPGVTQLKGQYVMFPITVTA